MGPNNAGKTALAQAIQLLAGGLAPSERDAREPLPLESGGIRHGETFEDLVTGRAAHGRLKLSITLADGSAESSLAAAVTNVAAPGRASERQISEWRLRSGDREISAERPGFGETSEYRISISGAPDPNLRTMTWRGLLPRRPEELVDWAGPETGSLRTWAAGVRHLRCPRRLPPSPFTATEHASAAVGPDGRLAPLALAADDALRASVRDWCRRTFGVRIDVAAQGKSARGESPRCIRAAMHPA